MRSLIARHIVQRPSYWQTWINGHLLIFASLTMENLTPAQRSQLEVSQMKDFINTYNQVTESCFCDCVHDFTSRRITKQEVDCCMHCVDKYVKMTQRVSLRLQDHLQIQQPGSPQQGTH